MKKSRSKTKIDSFDFEQISEILGSGIQIVERELFSLAEKSKKNELTESDSKLLIAYLNVLREVKKDYLAEVANIQKELKSLTTSELQSLLVESNESSKSGK